MTERLTARAWARFMLTGIAPFKMTRGERAFFTACQVIDVALIAFGYGGLTH